MEKNQEEIRLNFGDFAGIIRRYFPAETTLRFQHNLNNTVSADISDTCIDSNQLHGICCNAGRLHFGFSVEEFNCLKAILENEITIGTTVALW